MKEFDKMIVNKDILKWFTTNYKQNKVECIEILLQAQKDYPFTIEQIQDGCIEIRKINPTEKDWLSTHIKLLGEMCNVGINVKIAGEKIREAILKSKVINSTPRKV